MDTAPRDDVEIAQSADCASGEDFFTDDARELLARAGAAYLIPQKLTPLEVLYNPDQQRRFMDAGTQAQQALQKIAGWQVRGRETSVGERLRQLWDLVDEAMKLTSARLEAIPPTPLTPANLAELGSVGEDEELSDWRFRLHACVSLTLSEKKNWAEKISEMLALIEATKERKLLQVLDEHFAELIRHPDALAVVTGEEETPGKLILLLMNLINGTVDEEDARPSPLQAKPFFKIVHAHPMKATRNVMSRHALRIVSSNDKMTKDPIAQEIDFVIKLKDRMRNIDDKLVGGEATIEALEGRLGRALSDQTIDMLMEGTKSVGERVLRALQIQKRVFGETAERYLTNYVSDLMGQPQIERKLVAEDANPKQKIAFYAKLWRGFQTSKLGDHTKSRFADQVEKLHVQVLEETKFLQRFTSGKAPLAGRLTALAEMIAKGSFIDGVPVSQARKIAQSMMKSPEFLSEYTAGIESKEDQAIKLKALQTLIKNAGLA